MKLRGREMNAVAIQYFDERGGFWRVGYLEKADLKWARVHPMVGPAVRIPIAQTREVEQAKPVS